MRWFVIIKVTAVEYDQKGGVSLKIEKCVERIEKE